MVEERWLEAAEAYRRYCDIENDVSNEIRSSKLSIKHNVNILLYYLIVYFLVFLNILKFCWNNSKWCKI